MMKSVVVTGGAVGLGAGIARKFDAEGFRVGVLDLDSPRPARFSEADARGCEALMARLAPRLAEPRIA